MTLAPGATLKPGAARGRCVGDPWAFRPGILRSVVQLQWRIF